MRVRVPFSPTFDQAWTIIEDLKRLPKKTLYEEYLKSPEWFRLRERVLERDGHKCTKCGSANRLQAHHETYERVGGEDMDDLVTLCVPCHEAMHGKIRGRKRV